MQGIQVIMLCGCESRRRVISDIGVSKRSDWCFGEVNQKSNSSEKKLKPIISFMELLGKVPTLTTFFLFGDKASRSGASALNPGGGHLVEEKDGFCIEEDRVEILVTAGRVLRARRHLIWNIYNIVGFITICYLSFLGLWVSENTMFFVCLPLP